MSNDGGQSEVADVAMWEVIDRLSNKMPSKNILMHYYKN